MARDCGGGCCCDSFCFSLHCFFLVIIGVGVVVKVFFAQAGSPLLVIDAAPAVDVAVAADRCCIGIGIGLAG